MNSTSHRVPSTLGNPLGDLPPGPQQALQEVLCVCPWPRAAQKLFVALHCR